MLKIYFNPDWASTDSWTLSFFRPLMLPFHPHGKEAENEWTHLHTQYICYASEPSEADLIGYPARYPKSQDKNYQEALHLAQLHNKPMLVFGGTDHYNSPPPRQQAQVIIFHPTITFKSTQDGVHCQPFLFETDYHPQTFAPQRPWQPAPHSVYPRVLWAGATQHPNFWKHQLHCLFRHRYYFRQNMVQALQSADNLTLIATHATQSWWSETREARHNNRKMYVEDMLRVTYVLTPPGLGDTQSTTTSRFYEVIAMGRIPVIVDKNLYLPFSKVLDWRQHCVLVPPNKLHKTAEYVHRFHRQHSPEALAEIQTRLRQAWETHYAMPSFYPYLVNGLHQIVAGEAPATVFEDLAPRNCLL